MEMRDLFEFLKPLIHGTPLQTRVLSLRALHWLSPQKISQLQVLMSKEGDFALFWKARPKCTVYCTDGEKRREAFSSKVIIVLYKLWTHIALSKQNSIPMNGSNKKRSRNVNGLCGLVRESDGPLHSPGSPDRWTPGSGLAGCTASYTLAAVPDPSTCTPASCWAHGSPSPASAPHGASVSVQRKTIALLACL